MIKHFFSLFGLILFLLPLSAQERLNRLEAVERSTVQNKNMEATDLKQLFDKSSVFVSATMRPGSASNYRITLPDVLSVSADKSLKISVKDSSDVFDYVLEAQEQIIDLGSGKYAKRYYLHDGEELEVSHNGIFWRIINSNYSKPTAWGLEEKLIAYETYDTYRAKPLPDQDHSVDALAVIKKGAKVVWGENRAKKSDNVSQFPFWNTNAGKVVFKQNKAYAPNGKLAVDRIIPQVASPSFYYTSGSGGAGGDAYDLWQPNTTYTVSFWCSVATGDDSWIYPTLANSTLATNPDTFYVSENRLIRRSWTLQTDGAINPRERIYFYLSAQDSLNFWNLQIERTAIASPDIVTGLNNYSNQDSLFLIVQPRNGKLAYSQSANIGAFEPSDIAQSYVDYCSQLSSCNEVQIDDEVIFRKPVTIPGNMIFSGGGEKTAIIAELDNTQGAVLILGNLTDPYNEGIVLRDLTIRAGSPARSAIQFSRGLELRFDNLTIDGTANRYFDHGIYEPLNGNRSIDLDFNKLFLSGCDTALHTSMQASSTLRNVSIRDFTDVGIFQDGGGFTAHNLLLEKIDRSGLIATPGDRIHLIGGRIENVPYTTDYPTLDIRGMDLFTVENADLGPVHSFAADSAVIKLDAVDIAKVEGVTMITYGAGVPVSTTAATASLWWGNNHGAANNLNENYIDAATLLFNFDTKEQNTKIPRQIIEAATVDQSYLLDNAYDGQMQIYTDTIQALGPHNLLQRSNAIAQFPFWNSNGSSVAFTTGQTDPNGGTTASRIQYNSGTHFTYIPNSGGTAFSWLPDTWYNLSFYAKVENPGDNNWIYPDLADAAFVTRDTAQLSSTSYQRFDWTFKTRRTIAADERLEFHLGSGDPIVFAFPQLSLGSHVKAYRATTASSNVPYTGAVWKGDLEVTGSLNAQQYRQFHPMLYNAVDNLPIERLESGYEALFISDELDGLDIQLITYGTARNVTADTQVRLSYFDVSAGTYSSFGSATIPNGSNQVTVQGLSQSVERGDWIYAEVVTGGAEANGLSISLKLQ